MLNDGDGASSANYDTTISVAAVNDAPNVSAPGTAYNFTEQSSLIIHGTGFSVADVDDNGGTMTAVFTVGEGRVLIDAGNSGVTLTSGNFVTSGNSTDTVTFTGTKAQINALLSGSSTGTIVYYYDQLADSDTPSATTSITLTVNDQGNTGADPGNTGDGSSEENAATQTINISSVNDAPSFLSPSIILNGTFDTDLSGWSTTGTVNHAFGRAAFGGSSVDGPQTISQTIATTAGETYLLEFDYRDSHPSLNQQLQVTVDGASNLLTTEQILSDTDGTSLQRYRFTFTADSASATVTFSDTSDDVGSNSARSLGLDSAIDNVSVQQAEGQVGTVAFTEDGGVVTLNTDTSLSDPELDALNGGNGNYAGASLALVRNGGVSVEDVFGFNDGNGITLSGGNLIKNSQIIASFDTTTVAGQLAIAFTDAGGETPTSADVENILRQITYANSSDTPPASVQIDWTINDGNGVAQGAGGALAATGSTTVNITAVNDAPVNTVPGTQTVAEETTTAIGGISIGDVDDLGANLTTRLQVTSGVLNVTLSGSASISAGVNGTGDLTIQGTETDINATLASLTYTGNIDVTGTNADTLTVTTDDGGNTGSAAAHSKTSIRFRSTSPLLTTRR